MTAAVLQIQGYICAALLLIALPVAADSEDEAESRYDKIWSRARLHEGDSESFFRSVDLSGRLQLDLAYAESDDANHSELNLRRFRFGFKAQFPQSFTLHIEAEFNPQEADPVYTRLTDTYIAWSPGDDLQLKLGKQSAGFTLDGMTSSKELLTIDRSNLANNIWFTEEYIPGLSVRGGSGGLTYFVGLFSSGDETPEFGDFKGGEFVLATLGYDFAFSSAARRALVRLNLVDNQPDPENGFTRPLEHIASVNFDYRNGPWGLGADLSVANGYGEQSDLVGFMVMPSRQLGDALQLVARYTHVESDEVNGVRFARYESSISDGVGDRYDEVYLGANYYWYGHKLKLQIGIQHVRMRDRADDGGEYSGWSATSGFRVSW